MFFKNLPVSGFKLRTSGIGSDRSANWATTTAQLNYYLWPNLLRSNFCKLTFGFVKRATLMLIYSIADFLKKCQIVFNLRINCIWQLINMTTELLLLLFSCMLMNNAYLLTTLVPLWLLKRCSFNSDETSCPSLQRKARAITDKAMGKRNNIKWYFIILKIYKKVSISTKKKNRIKTKRNIRQQCCWIFHLKLCSRQQRFGHK